METHPTGFKSPRDVREKLASPDDSGAQSTSASARISHRTQALGMSVAALAAIPKIVRYFSES